MNPETSFYLPQDPNEAEKNDAEVSRPRSPSYSISSSDTEELDSKIYHEYCAQAKLDRARKDLIPTLAYRYRYSAFLSRADHSTGKLSSPQPLGEARDFLSPEQMEESRRESKGRRSRRLSDGRDPVVALRRNQAVTMWNEGREGGMRREWEEARSGMERMNGRLGIRVIPPGLLQRKRKRAEEKDQEGEGESSRGKRRQVQHSQSPSSSNQPPPPPTTASFSSPQRPIDECDQSIHEPSTLPLPSLAMVLAHIPSNGISPRALTQHFFPLITNPHLSATSSKKRKLEFLALIRDTDMIVLDVVTRRLFIQDSVQGRMARTLEQVRGGSSRVDVRGLGRRAGRWKIERVRGGDGGREGGGGGGGGGWVELGLRQRRGRRREAARVDEIVHASNVRW